jgi:hypothetical protein
MLNGKISLPLREMSNNFLLFHMLKIYEPKNPIDEKVIQKYLSQTSDIRVMVCQRFFDDQILSGKSIERPHLWLQTPTENWSKVFEIILGVHNHNEQRHDIKRCFLLCVMLHYQPILQSRCKNLPKDIFQYMPIIKQLTDEFFKSKQFCCPPSLEKMYPRKPCNLSQVYSNTWYCCESFMYYVQTASLDIIQKYGSNGVFILKHCWSRIYSDKFHLIPKQWRKLECYQYYEYDVNTKDKSTQLTSASKFNNQDLVKQLMEQDVLPNKHYIESNGKNYMFEFHFRLYPDIDFNMIFKLTK